MRWHGGVRFCELRERRRRRGAVRRSPARRVCLTTVNMRGGITPRICDGGGALHAELPAMHPHAHGAYTFIYCSIGRMIRVSFTGGATCHGPRRHSANAMPWGRVPCRCMYVSAGRTRTWHVGTTPATGASSCSSLHAIWILTIKGKKIRCATSSRCLRACRARRSSAAWRRAQPPLPLSAAARRAFHFERRTPICVCGWWWGG